MIKIFGLLCYPITEGYVDTFRSIMRIYKLNCQMSLSCKILFVGCFLVFGFFYILVIIILSDGNYRPRERRRKKDGGHVIDELL